MGVYAAEVERMMTRLFDSLKESDRVGLAELEGGDDLDIGRTRKKGADGNG